MKKKILAGVLAGTLFSTQAYAAHACAGAGDELAMKTSAMQQALMVAALSCNAIPRYNDFVVSHRSDLQRADHALLLFFERENGARGESDYHAFKTKAANVSSLESARNNGPYCANAERLFEAAESGYGADLATFVARQWSGTGEFIRASCTFASAREAMTRGVSRLFESPVPASPADPGLSGENAN